MLPQRIRVLIVDDSALMRRLLARSLAGVPDIEVIGSASDAWSARENILNLKPDVVTLDIEMPRMNGLTFLEKLMQHHPLPVIVVSSYGGRSCDVALSAIRLGAIDIIGKPAGPGAQEEFSNTLADKIRAGAASKLLGRRPGADSAQSPMPGARSRHSFIAIGASTGGTQAIRRLLARFPADCPPVAIVQHIPGGFSASFARGLNETCAPEVKEASDGDTLAPGRVLIAPGGFHMEVIRRGDSLGVALNSGPKLFYQRPAVDVLFHSVADQAGSRAAGLLLTGMGVDGAAGLLRMRHAGAHTIAQDEASCVVFGMPGEAVRIGAAARVMALDSMAEELFAHSRVSAPV
jgi:two-component system chemotaxis response regulator CheB